MPDKISLIFKAIADPTRREIFHALVVAATALPITQIAEKFEISRQGITKHLAILEEAELVVSTSLGRERICYSKVETLQEINAWIRFYDKFWDKNFDKLEKYLNKKA
jgi:DNA-binding transcriptional ArsR family regulator